MIYQSTGPLRPPYSKLGCSQFCCPPYIEIASPGLVVAGLGLDVHHAGGLEPILRRQRTGDQRHAVGKAGLERLAEHRQPLRQFDAVEPVLHVGMLAAQVDLAETVLRHAGGLEQHLVERRVVSLGNVLRVPAARNCRWWRRDSAGSAGARCRAAWRRRLGPSKRRYRRIGRPHAACVGMAQGER